MRNAIGKYVFSRKGGVYMLDGNSSGVMLLSDMRLKTSAGYFAQWDFNGEITDMLFYDEIGKTCDSSSMCTNGLTWTQNVSTYGGNAIVKWYDQSGNNNDIVNTQGSQWLAFRSGHGLYANADYAESDHVIPEMDSGNSFQIIVRTNTQNINDSCVDFTTDNTNSVSGKRLAGFNQTNVGQSEMIAITEDGTFNSVGTPTLQQRNKISTYLVDGPSKTMDKHINNIQKPSISWTGDYLNNTFGIGFYRKGTNISMMLGYYNEVLLFTGEESGIFDIQDELNLLKPHY